MTRSSSIPRGPFDGGDELANVGNAFTVLHFYLLGHEDSWGSCAACHEIIDDACPEYTSLRKLNQRGEADSAAVATTRWPDAVRTMVDQKLFSRLVRHPRVPLRSVHPIVDEASATRSFSYLIGSDVAVIEAAIARGRGVMNLHDFVCRPRVKGSPHDRGTAEHPLPCTTCTMLAGWVATTIDMRAKEATKGESHPKGRLKAIAQFCMFRTSLRNVALDSYETERTAMDLGMKADPDANLPNAILDPIKAHPERTHGMETYILLTKAMKKFATDISPNAKPETQVPYRRIGEKVLGLTEQETKDAWRLVEEACDASTRSAQKLDEHVRNHLDRRLSGAPLVTRGPNNGPVRQTTAVTRANARDADGSSSLRSEVIDSIENASRTGPRPVQRHEIEDALYLELTERAPHLFDSEVDDLSDASRQGDPAQVARLDGFQDLVDEIWGYFNDNEDD